MHILFVEDDPGLGNLLQQHYQADDHKVTLVEQVSAANQFLKTNTPDLVVCDHDLPDGNGLDLMESILNTYRSLPCIMLTGVGNERLAVKAMKLGARDYVVKDIENNFLALLQVCINRIEKEQAMAQELVIAEREKSRLEARNRYLSSKIKKQVAGITLIGQDTTFKQLLKTIEQVAPTNATVLLTGETGTGKEVAAQLIHDMSARTAAPLITVNCAALPEHLIESELFGHMKGAFTGAVKSNIGRFEAADGGTLFLDEIGELPFELQAKLLRVLQESKFERIGSSSSQHVDVRIIAATNQDLLKKIDNKTFREDLYYRLNVVPIHIPPLRHRSRDVELLFTHFIHCACDQHELPPPAITDNLISTIQQHPWLGNIRELKNYVERSVIMQKWEPLTPASSDIEHKEKTDNIINLLPLEDIERNHIIKILQHTHGVIAGKDGAAQILELNANTLRSRMKKLNISKPNYSL
jgi:DNA-binding NtrC family response regulator